MEKYLGPNRHTGENTDRHDFIDVCVFANTKKIAVEYDNGNHSKLKSISKLFCSNVDLPFGIVRGKQSKPFLRFENIATIRRIARDASILNKEIYLIVVEDKIAEWVNV